jgi:hypothetical protein
MLASAGAISSSAIWFVVRVVLEMPSGTPIFSGGAFSYGDGVMLVVGIVGLVGLIYSAIGAVFR